MLKESIKKWQKNIRKTQRLKLKNHIENVELKLLIATCFDVDIWFLIWEVSGIEPRASQTLGKYSTTKL